jgi:hypothetical protein
MKSDVTPPFLQQLLLTFFVCIMKLMTIVGASKGFVISDVVFFQRDIFTIDPIRLLQV